MSKQYTLYIYTGFINQFITKANKMVQSILRLDGCSKKIPHPPTNPGMAPRQKILNFPFNNL